MNVIDSLKMNENTPSPDTFKQRNGTVRFGRKKDEFVDELEKGTSGDRKPEEMVQVPADVTASQPYSPPRPQEPCSALSVPNTGSTLLCLAFWALLHCFLALWV